jgi:hypothetical protein
VKISTFTRIKEEAVKFIQGIFPSKQIPQHLINDVNTLEEIVSSLLVPALAIPKDTVPFSGVVTSSDDRHQMDESELRIGLYSRICALNYAAWRRLSELASVSSNLTEWPLVPRYKYIGGNRQQSEICGKMKKSWKILLISGS